MGWMPPLHYSVAPHPYPWGRLSVSPSFREALTSAQFPFVSLAPQEAARYGRRRLVSAPVTSWAESVLGGARRTKRFTDRRSTEGDRRSRRPTEVDSGGRGGGITSRFRRATDGRRSTDGSSDGRPSSEGGSSDSPNFSTPCEQGQGERAGWFLFASRRVRWTSRTGFRTLSLSRAGSRAVASLPAEGRHRSVPSYRPTHTGLAGERQQRRSLVEVFDGVA